MAETLTRVAPILAFLVAITVVAELADRAGVFVAASSLTTRLGGGSVGRLWLIICVLAVLCTAVLSLDTTAVLLTPVVLVTARRLGIAPWPFALATVWLANTASLVLPVSNLTNLLLIDQLDWSVFEYLSRMWFPAAVAIVVSVGVLWLLLRASLVGRFGTPTQAKPNDRVLFVIATATCLAVGPLFVAGVEPWIVATGAASLLLAAFAIRARGELKWALAPWQLVVFTILLFLAVGLLQQLRLLDWLADVAGTGTGLVDLLRMAGTGAVASNVINNLPAYVALEPLASDSSDRLLALLIGTNLGPLITLWASLATLLWRDRCRTENVVVSARRFASVGMVGVPVLLVATSGALWLTI